jgi:XisH protein
LQKNKPTMAKDLIHEAVRNALQKDGWVITDDPLYFIFDEEDTISIDLGAENQILAEKGNRKIAVEIKTFNQPSLIYEFHKAIGQYFNYETALMEAMETDRKLYIAAPETIYPRFMAHRIMKKSIERMKMRFILVDIKQEIIVEWKE